MGVIVKKSRQYCYIPLHDEVKLALVDWTKENSVDIAFVPLVRFLISYAYTNHIREDYASSAKESIYLLDESNRIASDGKMDGRMRERIQTASNSIVSLTEEERYLALLCGMHALDITIEELAI